VEVTKNDYINLSYYGSERNKIKRYQKQFPFNCSKTSWTSNAGEVRLVETVEEVQERRLGHAVEVLGKLAETVIFRLNIDVIKMNVKISISERIR